MNLQAQCLAVLESSVKQVPVGLTVDDWGGICAARETARYAMVPLEDGWSASNPGQQWTTTFDACGFVTQPRSGDWQWGLTLFSYGYGDSQHRVNGKPIAEVDGQRLVYTWDEAVREWYTNDPRGLEHGFTVTQRPTSFTPDNRPLCFTLAIRGNLKPLVTSNAQGVCFVDDKRATVLTYSGLKVWDAEGKSLPSWVAVVGSELNLLVDDRQAAYPVTIDPIAQQAYIKASNTDAEDRFGGAVAVAGETVVVGATYESSNATGVNGPQSDNSQWGAGAVYVFTRIGTSWIQEAYLKASNAETGDEFGFAVAASDETIVVGAPYESSNATGVNGEQSNNSAWASGAAYVFTRNGNTWSQQAYLKASNTGEGDFFGHTVAIMGETIVIGAPSEASSATGVNGNQGDNMALLSGSAYVFVRTGSNWLQEAYLKASNTNQNDRFGNSVSCTGETVVVGAYNESSNATGVNGDDSNNDADDSGAAYVFARTANLWAQQAYLKASNTEADDYFGQSVTISGETIVVGAAKEASSAAGANGNETDNSAPYSGAAYVFVRSGEVWSQQAYLKASNTDALDGFGGHVAMSGETLVVGAGAEASNATGVNGDEANNDAFGSGAAYLFERNGTTWTQLAFLKASNTVSGMTFGSVAISENVVCVGAPFESSASTGVNGNQANFGAPTSGAAYIFTGMGITSIAGPGEMSPSLLLSPNPVLDRLWMTMDEQPLEIRIINASGANERALPFTWRSGSVELDASGLAPGAHMIWVRTKEGLRTARFVKL